MTMKYYILMFLMVIGCGDAGLDGSQFQFVQSDAGLDVIAFGDDFGPDVTNPNLVEPDIDPPDAESDAPDNSPDSEPDLPPLPSCDADNPCGYPEICIQGSCYCVPQCQGLECGDDGCGGTCGSCDDGDECVEGFCECVPNCTNKLCGDDGCGGTCGSCDDGDVCTGEEICSDGQCVAGEVLDCNDSNDHTKDSCDPTNGCKNEACVVDSAYWDYESEKCVYCLNDDHCGTGEICNQVIKYCMDETNPCAWCTPEKPFCLAETCVECNVDDQCGENEVCFKLTGDCIPATAN